MYLRHHGRMTTEDYEIMQLSSRQWGRGKPRQWWADLLILIMVSSPFLKLVQYRSLSLRPPPTCRLCSFPSSFHTYKHMLCSHNTHTHSGCCVHFGWEKQWAHLPNSIIKGHWFPIPCKQQSAVWANDLGDSAPNTWQLASHMWTNSVRSLAWTYFHNSTAK